MNSEHNEEMLTMLASGMNSKFYFLFFPDHKSKLLCESEEIWKMFMFKSYKILITFHSLNILASQPILIDLIKLKE